MLKPRDDFYSARHPTAADTLLIIEVSETTLRYDRQIKLPLYARHGVPEVWIIDLPGHQIHFFRLPSDEQYPDATTTTTAGIVTISSLPGVTVDLSGLLPT